MTVGISGALACAARHATHEVRVDAVASGALRAAFARSLTSCDLLAPLPCRGRTQLASTGGVGRDSQHVWNARRVRLATWLIAVTVRVFVPAGQWALDSALVFLAVKLAFESFGRSNHVGTCDDGQFVLMEGVSLPPKGTGPWDFRVGGDDRGAADHVGVVLHLFDWEGRHRRTTVHWIGREGPEIRGAVASATNEILGGLGAPHHEDVIVRPFDVSVEGIRFALRRTLHPLPPFFEYEFSPYDMFIGWPFDGTYDT